MKRIVIFFPLSIRVASSPVASLPRADEHGSGEERASPHGGELLPLPCPSPSSARAGASAAGADSHRSPDTGGPRLRPCLRREWMWLRRGPMVGGRAAPSPAPAGGRVAPSPDCSCRRAPSLLLRRSLHRHSGGRPASLGRMWPRRPGCEHCREEEDGLWRG